MTLTIYIFMPFRCVHLHHSISKMWRGSGRFFFFLRFYILWLLFLWFCTNASYVHSIANHFPRWFSHRVYISNQFCLFFIFFLMLFIVHFHLVSYLPFFRFSSCFVLLLGSFLFPFLSLFCVHLFTGKTFIVSISSILPCSRCNTTPTHPQSRQMWT